MENLSQPTYVINPNYKLNIGNAFSGGLELFKKDVGSMLINYLMTIVISMIPFCSLLGIGNFYKSCRKIERGEKTEAGDIFNFDDIVPYLIFAFVMVFAVIAMVVPVEIMVLFSAVFAERNNGIEPVFVVVIIIAVLLLLAMLMVVSSVMYYYVAVVALFGVKEFSKALKISWTLFKKNALSSIMLAIVVSLVGSLGVLLCGVGMFLSMPLAFCIRYVATKNIMIRFEEQKIDYAGNF
ncbi:hypothetical protein [Elizabethkingia meningoseptica]|uniref:hypothetical protein n=1 Tax=Elizabethkingia meningoseptica TaxID=238 RepID=UPI0038919A6B